MATARIDGFRVAGISTCVPARRLDNLANEEGFDPGEARKVVSMAGVRHRHVVAPGTTSADLCFEAAERLLDGLGWDRASVDALIMVTQTPDYALPSTSCLLQHRLGLSDACLAFDIGLGCSGYPYGLYVAASLLKAGGQKRVLLLHGETPSRFVAPEDHAATMLFGDAGSATALELCADAEAASFVLHTDGAGAEGLIIHGGGFRDRAPADPREMYLRMDGAEIFNFTLQRVPALVRDTLALARLEAADIDHFVMHQANRFVMKHLAKKCGMPPERVPFTIEDTANCVGPSIPVTITRAVPAADHPQRLMLLGFGVGLSWGGAVISLQPQALRLHGECMPTNTRAAA